MTFTIFFMLVVFLFGLSLGAGVTAIVMSTRRQTIIESSSEPPALRDPANPYEPSAITTRVVRARTGCGLGGIVLLLIFGMMIAAIMALVTLRPRVVVVPAPVAPPTTATL